MNRTANQRHAIEERSNLGANQQIRITRGTTRISKYKHLCT